MIEIRWLNGLRPSLEPESPQQAIDLCDTFFNKCGEHLRLRWITYEAYKRLSQWDKAIGEVDRLIADDPYDKDYRCWRGIALERKGDFEGAIQDYRQALALAPSLGRIPFNIANFFERVGKPCEAIFPVEQYLFYHPKDRNDPAIQRRFVTIHQNGSCQGYTSGPDQTVVRFQPGSGAVPCEVRVNGVVSGRFVVIRGPATPHCQESSQNALVFTNYLRLQSFSRRLPA